MSRASFDQSLDWLRTPDHRGLLRQGLRGFEKECLRVGPDGRLSAAPHAAAFGSALTHPSITTDYSEALLEFVTPPLRHSEAGIAGLADLHAFVLRHAGDELLWPASMPCIIAADESVPIAQYGPSNEGRLRTIYRSGLGLRYGRAMQAIAGTHFNYSLPADFWPAYQEQLGSRLGADAFRSDCLMGLVRNFRRWGWLVTYLFGASPAFCKSFRPQGHARLQSLNADTWYAPWSTSLRMSDMGYRNTTQARLSISVNSLAEYLAELEAALTTIEPRYEAIGVVVDGDYRQLNANILQLENEYYSSIRPKPKHKSPRLIAALRAGGIEYVEIRTLDLNPFAAVGVTAGQARLLELLLLACLLEPSPPISPAEQEEIDQRELAVAWEGRKPGLNLPHQGGRIALAEFAREILDRLSALAPLLDADGRGTGTDKDDSAATTATLAAAAEAVRDPAATLSARVLDGLDAGRRSFFDWAFEIAVEQREQWLRHRFETGRLAELEAIAAASLQAASDLESAAGPPFAEYLEALAAGVVAGTDRARRIL